jgi:peptidoglycan/xylan/chitin deacetylase (PgdA/CDA1 family)
MINFKRIFLFFFILNNINIYANNVTLCYHQFDYSLNNIYSVTPEIFEWQIQYLKENKIDILSEDEMLKNFSTKNKNIGNNVFITIDDGWKNETNIASIINLNKIPVTFYLISDVIGKKPAYLSYDDIRTLSKINEINFGCHSSTHRPLVRLKKYELEKEIVDSKKNLEVLLSKKIKTFAYPYGMFDSTTKKYAINNYSLSFGTDDGVNTTTSDKADLKRNLIYNTTTIGEFIDIIDNIYEKNQKEYKLNVLGYDNNGFKRFKFEKIKIFQFPIEDKSKNILVIPDSKIGAGWFYKSIEKLKNNEIKTNVCLGRNNNAPFYRPAKEKLSMNTWDLQTFMQDVYDSINFISKDKPLVIVTWGDGFEITMATLAKYDLKGKIKGIITINPSISQNDKKQLKNNINYYNNLLKKNKYSSEPFSQYQKLKIFSELAVINKNEQSPFASKLGLKFITNYDLFMKTLKEELNLTIRVGNTSRDEITEDDISKSITNILPAFSKFTPLKVQKEINQLLLNDFVNEKSGIINKNKIDLNLVILSNNEYIKSQGRIKDIFPDINITKTYSFKDNSTIEIMLSNSAIDDLIMEINQMYF